MNDTQNRHKNPEKLGFNWRPCMGLVHRTISLRHITSPSKGQVLPGGRGTEYE
jgi:hypothetical protein